MTQITDGDFYLNSVTLAPGQGRKSDDSHGWHTRIHVLCCVPKSSATKGCRCDISTGEDVMQNEVQEFTVRDRLGPVKFTGRILADCRYGRMDKPRWTDMALYEITDPQRTMRSVEEIETELAQDLTKEPPFQELPEEQADALIGSMMPHIIPRIMNEQRPYRYVLEYIARSYVYHRADGPCARAHHRWTTVGHIKVSNHRWRNLFPCTRCKPEDLEDLDDNVRIAEEQEKSHPFVCTDAVDIVNHLYRKNGEITQLAAKVLIQAAGRDPEIRRAMKNRRL